jgi:hypothetical protein
MAILGYNVPVSGEIRLYDVERNSEVWSALSGPTTFFQTMFLGSSAFATLLYLESKSALKTFYSVASGLCVVAAFRSQQFSAPVSFGVAVFIGLAILFHNKKYRLALIVFLAALTVASFSAASIVSSVKYNLENRTISTISSTGSSTGSSTVTEASRYECSVDIPGSDNCDFTTLILSDGSQRLGLLNTAFSNFKSSPIFGVGFGNYSHLGIIGSSNKIGIYTYPHNIFMEVLAQSGLLGLLIFTIYLACLISLFFKYFSTNTASIFLAIYVLTVFVSSLFAGNYNDFFKVIIGFSLINSLNMIYARNSLHRVM